MALCPRLYAHPAATQPRCSRPATSPQLSDNTTVANLAVATVLLVFGVADAVPGAVLALVLATVAVLVGLTLVARGRMPFRAAIGIALVDVLLLVLAG